MFILLSIDIGTFNNLLKYLGLAPAQSIGTGTCTDFLPIENADTSLTIDGEVLRNIHPSCSVSTGSPLSEKVP